MMGTANLWHLLPVLLMADVQKTAGRPEPEVKLNGHNADGKYFSSHSQRLVKCSGRLSDPTGVFYTCRCISVYRMRI